MLFLWWIAEQGVWFAPLVGIALGMALYLDKPPWRRPPGPVAAVCALALLLLLDTSGVYPGPSRVSCTFAGGPPVCTELLTDAGHAGEERRIGTVDMTRSDDRAAPPVGTVGAEVETPLLFRAVAPSNGLGRVQQPSQADPTYASVGARLPQLFRAPAGVIGGGGRL